MTYPLGILHLSDCSLPYLFEITSLPTTQFKDLRSRLLAYLHTFTDIKSHHEMMIGLSHLIVMIEKNIHKIVLLCNYFLNELTETRVYL